MKKKETSKQTFKNERWKRRECNTNYITFRHVTSSRDVRNVYTRVVTDVTRDVSDVTYLTLGSAPRDLKLFVGLLDRFNRELLGFISRCVFPTKHKKYHRMYWKKVFIIHNFTVISAKNSCSQRGSCASVIRLFDFIYWHDDFTSKLSKMSDVLPNMWIFIDGYHTEMFVMVILMNADPGE